MALGAAFVPISSPPSSPSVGPTDSSPASSPAPAPIILDSPPNPARLSHPFAASSRSDRRSERSIATPPATRPSDLFSRAPGSRAFQESYGEDEYLNDTESGRVQSLAADNREASTWDEAISNAIDNGNGIIQLGSQELTCIPQSIGDLGKFFVTAERAEHTNATGGRLFSRTKTTPISTSYQSRSFERTTSISEASTGLAKDQIQLYLYANKIQKLPRELFSLTKMTVLSLRGNRLTFIPAVISHLTNLRELNVSNNQLTYLPSEMLDMKIQNLSLSSNPFHPVPRTSAFSETPRQTGSLTRRRSMTRLLSRMASSRTPDTRTVSPITLVNPHSHVPFLYELCLRVLMTPCLPLTVANLVELYILPIPGEWGSRPLPLHVRDTLNACIPESVSAPKTMSPNGTPRGRGNTSSRSSGDKKKRREVMGVGVCPNPSHRSKTVFVEHMEERFTWEKIIAGEDVGEVIPIQWRGCLKGCLSFLDSDQAAAAHGSNVQQGLENPSGDAQMTVNVDEDVEMDDSVVQPVRLAQTGFDDQDFEDDA